MEAALNKWEEQGKVLKKDSGEELSDTVGVGIVTAMMLESIQEFVYSSLGIAVEYDTILTKIRALVSNNSHGRWANTHGCRQGVRRLREGSNGVL